MRLLGVLILLFTLVEAKAQQPGTSAPAPAPVPATPSSGLTPTEMNALVNTLADTEAKSKQQQQNQPQPNPPAGAAAQPMIQQPAPALTPPPPPMQAPMVNSAPPPQQPPPPPPQNNGNGSGTGNSNGQAGRNKSPFMIPTELYNRVKQMQTVKTSPTEGVVDSQVEVRRRWPLRDYTLVAVMWGIKNPKAMIADRENKLHVFRVKDYIANSDGYISEITNGEVIVVERGAEIKLKLKSR